MRKLRLAFALLITLPATQFSFAQTAQQNFHIGLGAEVGLPTGGLTDNYNFSLGGTLRLQYDLNAPVALMLTTGYTSFVGKTLINGATITYQNSSYTRFPADNFVPLKAGVKVFAASKFYFTAEGGAFFATRDIDITRAVFSPGFGYGSRSGLDVGLRYDYMSNRYSTSSGQFVARIAYDF